MSMIAKSTVSDLAFDKTVVCTISDDSLSERGVYSVSDGASTYKVYSENTSYKVGEQVYVTIPEGDYSKQKIISGKYTADNDDYYNYVPSFNNFINISGNLNPNLGIYSLEANGAIAAKEIFSETFDLDAAYTTLGIQAKFMSRFFTKAYYGTYGLGLRVEYVDAETKTIKRTAGLVFSNNEMYGNSYQFESYYTQEKIFDIKSLGFISSITLYFYQEKNFSDIDGVAIDCGGVDNLFVKDCQVMVGYNSEDFDEDTVILSCRSSQNYSALTKDEDNGKDLSVAWLRGQGRDFKCITSLEGNISVHWYKYKLEDGVIDNLAGAFWEEIETAQDLFEYRFIPDKMTSIQQVKVIIEEFGEQDEWASGAANDSTLYVSNILSFNNSVSLDTITSLSLVNDLELLPADEYQGKYFLYDENGTIKLNTEAAKNRDLTVSYSVKLTGLDELDTGEEVTWIFPLVNTMIESPELGVEYFLDDGDIVESDNEVFRITRSTADSEGNVGDIFTKEESQSYRIKSFYSPVYSNNTIICVVKRNGIEYTISYELLFGTSGEWGNGYTIAAKVVSDIKNLTTYTTESNPLVIKVEVYDPKKVPLVDNIQFKYSWLFEQQGLTITDGVNERSGVQILTSDSDEVQVYINSFDSINDFKFGVLKIAVTGEKASNEDDEDTALYLEHLLPLSFCLSDTLIDCELQGSTKIIYNTQGTVPQYFKNKFEFYDREANMYKGVTGSWKMGYQNNNDKNFGPTISKQGVLSAPPLFLNDLKGMTIEYWDNSGKLLWTTPLVITQDIYGSDLLNSLGTKNLSLGEKNDIIFSATMGAGYRGQDDNLFYGVLMGEAASGSQNSRETGIYGYSAGKKSFGFKIDGTAFLGRQGRGQILFDGNSGQIKSSTYGEKQGMLLDVDDGYIEMYNHQRFREDDALIHVLLSTGSKPSRNGFVIQPFFQISVQPQGSTAKDLIRISQNEYFLQSMNFKDSTKDGAGIKINLASGSIKSYDFDLVARVSGESNSYQNSYIQLKAESSLDDITNSTISTVPDGTEIEFYYQLVEDTSNITSDELGNYYQKRQANQIIVDTAEDDDGNEYYVYATFSRMERYYYEKSAGQYFQKANATQEEFDDGQYFVFTDATDINASLYRNEASYSQSVNLNTQSAQVEGDAGTFLLKVHYENKDGDKADLLCLSPSTYILRSNNYSDTARLGTYFNVNSGFLRVYSSAYKYSQVVLTSGDKNYPVQVAASLPQATTLTGIDRITPWDTKKNLTVKYNSGGSFGVKLGWCGEILINGYYQMVPTRVTNKQITVVTGVKLSNGKLTYTTTTLNIPQIYWSGSTVNSGTILASNQQYNIMYDSKVVQKLKTSAGLLRS